MVFEIVDAQPADLAGGFSSIRMWINGVGMDRIYFGSPSTKQPLFLYPSKPILDIGFRYSGAQYSTTSTSQFDMLNLIWYMGVETAWVDPSGIRSLIFSLVQLFF